MNYWHRARLDAAEEKKKARENMGYKSERERIYTDAGIEMIVHILEKGAHLTRLAGSFTAGKIMTGDTFVFHNCVDWLVERGHLVVVSDTGRGQDQILRVNLKEF